MSEWAARRFWKETNVVEVEGGYSVTLDGRSVKTPCKTLLVVPTQALAQAICAEWDAQEERIVPTTMPFTRAANAALDKVASQHAEVAAMLAEYGATDLICYRADGPDGLVQRQSAAWDPLLDWAFETYGAKLEPTAGLMPKKQAAASLTALAGPLSKATAFELTVLHEYITLTGSLVIGLASYARYQPLETLWLASRIDEHWQAEQWGNDDEAQENEAFRRSAYIQAGELHKKLA